MAGSIVVLGYGRASPTTVLRPHIELIVPLEVLFFHNQVTTASFVHEHTFEVEFESDAKDMEFTFRDFYDFEYGVDDEGDYE